MFAELLEKLRRHEDLSSGDAARAMGAIMDGAAQPSQIAALLVALALKGERPSEIVGFAHGDARAGDAASRADRSRVRHVRHGRRRRAHVQRLDGGRAHRRRRRRARRKARQSRGLEQMRQRGRVRGAWPRASTRPPERVVDAIERANLAFFFAQVWHPSMRHAAATRRETRRAHGVQPARAPDESGASTPPARRRVAAGAHRAASRARSASWGPSAPGWSTAPAAWTRSRRSDTRRFPSCTSGAVNTFYVHPADAGIPSAIGR